MRGFAAGLAGTGAMTATLKLEQLARRRSRAGAAADPGSDEPVDYDASEHVVTAAAAVLRHRPATKAGNEALFLLVHWGYGSAVGIEYVELLRRHGIARATAEFYLLCQAMAMTLFPVLGGTPPPWRWPRRILISSLGQHAVYAIAVALTSRRLGCESAQVSGQAFGMSDPDDEKAGSQIVPDRPDGVSGEPTPADRESAERRDAEHDDPPPDNEAP